MKLTKIVLTGGPCAGKSTARNHIKQAFEKMGYTVLFVNETATDLINGGIAPWTLTSVLEFQRYQMEMQIAKENLFTIAANELGKDNVLLVCDRGTLDTKAFLTRSDWKALLDEMNSNEVELMSRYDAVFHLVTAAKGAAEFYTLANNSARTETAGEAIISDDKLIAAWTGHPHLRVIDNSTDFESKMHRLIAEIAAFLGEPEPCEIERKFLIDMPDTAMLESLPNCTKVNILQTYLCSDNPGEEIRVRQRGYNNNFAYFKTVKRDISPVKRIELEEQITIDEYAALLMHADMSKHPIRKTRYCLTYNNQYFEIDVYPFWSESAIIEIELNDENAPIDFPPFLNVVAEVTDDPKYRNSKLAELDVNNL